MGVRLGPDHEHIGNRRVRYPHFRAVQHIAARHPARRGFHAAGVGPGIGFGQPETADQTARRQFRQIFRSHSIRAIGIDRIHHQRRLHRHHRAVAAVHPLHLAGDQAVGHIARPQPAVLFGDRYPQQTHFAHFGKDRRVGHLIAIGLCHPGCQLFGGIGGGGTLQHPLLFRQLRGKAERVGPVELAQIGL